ncbi:MAG: toxic anion resistance protein, partial [Oscillospiraceae bacterium]|nr:toxic anion resistance protein [Oscillospiraceae bacterium]
IETFDEVLRIQEEGRTKRLEAEHELGRIEAELKAKLLDIKTDK